jgi:hypothetical protein
LRIIIIAIHVGAMKIYVTTLEALRRKERGVKRGCTQITTKIDGFLSFTPLMVMYFFCRLLFKLTFFITKLGLPCCVPYFMDTFNAFYQCPSSTPHVTSASSRK